MDEGFLVWEGVGFGNGKTGAGDWFFNTKLTGEAASEGGFAGADVADQFEDSSLIGGGR